MAVIEINWNPTGRHLRQFAVLQLLFFSLIGFWLHHNANAITTAWTVVSVSSVAAVLGLIWPQCLRWVFVVWLVAVFPIGWLVSHLMLAVLFYLVFTPIGFIMKLCRYDPMQRHLDRDAATYWKQRDVSDDTQRYFKQF